MVIKIREFYKKYEDKIIKGGTIIVFILGALLRLVELGEIPHGTLPDEAYAAYNAYGLMTEGIDSRGYAFPVYFVAWGSGMSVLYSYLGIPFLKIFGMNMFAFRLPQALLGIGAIGALYVIGKNVYSKKMGMFMAFFLAINPWHVMNTRFALDANMAPNTFMIAVAFLVMAFKENKDKYYYLFVIFASATLYCYAQSWIMIPIFIICCTLFYWKIMPKGWQLVRLIISLFILALPLLLFLAINLGLMEEIVTNYFSIPKLNSFRGEELSIDNLINSAKQTLKVILTQQDGKIHTYSQLVGAYYTITSPFIVLGIVINLGDFIFDWWKKEKSIENKIEYVFIFWLFSAGIICLLNENITIIHINLIHIPIIFYSCYGVWKISQIFHNRYVVGITMFFLAIACGMFLEEYMSKEQGYFFGDEAIEVIEVAKEYANLYEKDICIVEYATIKYSNLLWIELPSVSEYNEKVIYTGEPGWQELQTFEQFQYVDSVEEVKEDKIYIIPNVHSMKEVLDAIGYSIEEVNNEYALAYLRRAID